MADDTRIDDIVALVEDGHGNGREPDLAALCGGDAVLEAAVRERLRIFRNVARIADHPPAAPVRPPAPLPAGYELVRELGRGGMGVVYLARDPKGRAVAVKTLTHLDPARLDYLKREFSALAGLRHDNLVAIYGQVSDGANWFCVMEYVEGEHLLDHVRSERGSDDGSTAAVASPDLPRLRAAFAQLAAGIHALHAANKLHRDIKSVNVKVTRDGRVKLIDFGLVAEMGGDQEKEPLTVAGTRRYMSPEQCWGRPLSPASDWYSFGVLLFEALTGELPFAGNDYEVMHQKQTVAPRSPSAIVPGVPTDLEALCLELLRPDPAARPVGADVLRRFGAAVPAPRLPAVAQPLLIGRGAHLAALLDAAATVRRTRRPVIVEVHGPSGAGKTALVERFLQDIRAEGDAVILSGRCYEQSSVPYKALDSLIDALCRYLRRLSREQAAAVLPVHPPDLARLFPVLGRLEAVAESRPANTDDPHEARRLGFQALRELCSRIAARKPLFLFADDVQWGDRESAVLLTELIRPPDAPPFVFLASYRRAAGGPFVAALEGMPVERRAVAVDPLATADACALAAALLGESGPRAERFARVIARESVGSPLLVHELVEHQSGTPDSTDPPTIETVIRTRVARLTDETRRLLEVVTLSAGPLDVECAFRAADVPPDRQAAALDVLLSGRAVRTSGGEDAPRTVEPFHDRVRETVAADLSKGARAAHHRRLAVVLTASGSAEPEVLAYHFERAGEPRRAADDYARAGEQSAKVLAFDRSAEQYAHAIDLCDATDPRRMAWLLARAASLSSAARAMEAAALFSEAAALCTGTDATFWRQRAAEQLIRGGRIDDGMGVLREVLAAVGITLPPTDRALRRSLGWMRLRLWLRGTRFRERPAGGTLPEERLRIEICRWAAGLLRISDILKGTWFHSLGLLLSLRAGDPYGVAFALGREMIIPPLFGHQTADRIDRIMREARDIATRIANPDERTYTEAILPLYRVLGLFLLGDIRGALAHVTATDAGLEKCIGPSAGFQRSTLRLFEAHGLLFLGELPRFRAAFDESYRALAERGNLHGTVTLPLLTRAHQIALADDRPDEARRLVRDSIGLWSRTGLHLQHMCAWWCEMDVLLYEGRGRDAWAQCREWWDSFDRPSLLVDLNRMFALWTRARAAVAYAAELGAGHAPERRHLLREATRAARALERQRVPHFAPTLGRSIRAAIAHLEGDRAGALRELERAEGDFARWGLALHAVATSYRRGQLLGGAAGAALVTGVEAELRKREVRNPARFVEVYAPGFRV